MNEAEKEAWQALYQAACEALGYLEYGEGLPRPALKVKLRRALEVVRDMEITAAAPPE